MLSMQTDKTRLPRGASEWVARQRDARHPAPFLVSQVASALLFVGASQAFAQPVQPRVASQDVSCGVRAQQIAKSEPTRETMRDALRCVGDRKEIAEILWSRPIADGASLLALQDATVGYSSPRLVEMLGRVAKSDPSSLRRFTAIGQLARLINRDISIHPNDGPLWGIADSSQLTFPIRFSTHQGAAPSPESRSLARAQLEMVAEAGEYLDARRIARFLVSSSLMR